MSVLTGSFEFEKGFDPCFPGEPWVDNGTETAPFFAWYDTTFIGIDPNGILLCVCEGETEADWVERFYGTDEPMTYDEAVAAVAFISLQCAEEYIDFFTNTYQEY